MGENGQSFMWIAKSSWDQTVGSERAVSAVRKSGSLSTGSPVGSLELTSLKGLNVQSGHCNNPKHRVRAVSVWSGGLKIETWEAQKGFAALERYPAQVAFRVRRRALARKDQRIQVSHLHGNHVQRHHRWKHRHPVAPVRHFHPRTPDVSANTRISGYVLLTRQEERRFSTDLEEICTYLILIFYFIGYKKEC